MKKNPPLESGSNSFKKMLYMKKIARAQKFMAKRNLH
jgi:hypothetical protein